MVAERLHSKDGLIPADHILATEVRPGLDNASERILKKILETNKDAQVETDTIPCQDDGELLWLFIIRVNNQETVINAKYGWEVSRITGQSREGIAIFSGKHLEADNRNGTLIQNPQMFIQLEREEKEKQRQEASISKKWRERKLTFLQSLVSDAAYKAWLSTLPQELQERPRPLVKNMIFSSPIK